MKAWLFAAAVALAATDALLPMAQAAGPRPSSEDNWPGMTFHGANVTTPAAPSQAAATHYVWQEGYDHGGKWHGHWVLVP
jgi:hypothetical protein